MVLALSVEVDGERQVLARLEQINLLFQQQRIGAEVDVLLALHETGDNLVNLRMQQWLATRNRHRRCAALFDSLEALLGRELHFQHVPGYWIFPQPAHARLQRNSGSSIKTSGYCLRPFSFCLRTYVATVHACEIGTAMLSPNLRCYP